MNRHCGRYDLSEEYTLKLKQSQPSPPTLATESYGYALTGRVERLSANHPPVAPLRLQAYRDRARSLGYPLAVVSLTGQKSETAKQAPARKTKAAVDRRQNHRMLRLSLIHI